MAKPCFYYPDLIGNTEVGSCYELPASESAHALQSRRLNVGSQIQLIDGIGCLAEAVIVESGRRVVSVQIDSISELSRTKPLVHCFIAMPKGDRQKVMVDMLTQIGVASITPLVCERSISVPKATQLEKLARVSIEACKQSKNAFVAKIEKPCEFNELFGRDGVLVFCDQLGNNWREAKKQFATALNIMLVIGPEGGFSDTELTALRKANACSLALGQHILRTELAAISAAALFAC